MLELSEIKAGYGAIEALHGVSLAVGQGEIVTLVGANGAGKSTTLRAVSGLIAPRSGDIRFEGRSIARMRPHEIVRLGLAHVPEGRMVFANLTVLENLRMGAYLQPDRSVIAAEMEKVFGIFPRLSERKAQLAGTLSGGEQQMLAIGRALMGRPRFLMLDEPSLGIAPLLVKSIFEQIVRINRDHGLTILLVEQNANLALRVSRRGYVLETGRIAASGTSEALLSDPQVREAYLGGH